MPDSLFPVSLGPASEWWQEGEGTRHKTRAARGRSSDGGSAAWAFPGRAFTLIIKREGALASERATDHRAIRLPSPLHFGVRSGR